MIFCFSDLLRYAGKLKSVKIDLYKKTVFLQNYVFTFFSPKRFAWWLKIAAQIIFIDRQINLNAWNFKIIAYNQENTKIKVRYFRGSVDLVVLVFYGPSTHFRSFRVRSINLATLFLRKPPRQLPVLSAHSFSSNWRTWGWNPRLTVPGGRASDRATAPGKIWKKLTS